MLLHPCIIVNNCIYLWCINLRIAWLCVRVERTEPCVCACVWERKERTEPCVRVCESVKSAQSRVRIRRSLAVAGDIPWKGGAVFTAATPIRVCERARERES